MIDINQIVNTKYDKHCVLLSVKLASLIDFIVMVLLPRISSCNLLVWKVSTDVFVFFTRSATLLQMC